MENKKDRIKSVLLTECEKIGSKRVFDQIYGAISGGLTLGPDAPMQRLTSLAPPIATSQAGSMKNPLSRARAHEYVKYLPVVKISFYRRQLL